MGWAWKSRDMYVSPQNERYVRGLIRQARRDSEGRVGRRVGREVWREVGGARGGGVLFWAVLLYTSTFLLL